MSPRLLLLLCLIGPVFAEKPPDVDCIVIHLSSVRCSWNKQGTPDVNYTFYSWSDYNGGIRAPKEECRAYQRSKNNVNVGCDRPYNASNRSFHFSTFHTRLVHGNSSNQKDHALKNKVILNPPVHLTVLNGSDSNLWFYWNQSYTNCVESDVRFRVNDNKWTISKVSSTKQSYCINLPSFRSRYELQVRSKIASHCGESLFWSDWSEPAVWGFNNSTDPNLTESSMSVWSLVLYVLVATSAILLFTMFLQHDRLRIVLIPALPKPLIKNNIEDFKVQLPKGLSFTSEYNEPACPVREYCHLSQSDSESWAGSSSSVTTDQTDCSAFIPADETPPPPLHHPPTPPQ